MNIFASYACPVRSARVLDDRRVIKLTTESVQMLCTALRGWGAVKGKDGTELYRASHVNHPCNVWLRMSRANFHWLYCHAQELNAQYVWRFKKEHPHAAWYQALRWDLQALADEYMPISVKKAKATPFVNCASNLELGISFRNESDTHAAYRKYLGRRWQTDSSPPRCTWHPRYLPQFD